MKGGLMKSNQTSVGNEKPLNNTLDLVGSIWEKKAKSGGVYHSLAINKAIAANTNLVIFANKKPKNEKSPTFFVFQDLK